VAVVDVQIGQQRNVTVAPLGVTYVAFVKGQAAAKNVELVVEVPQFYNFSQLYVADGPPAAVPRDYEPLPHGQGYRREVGDLKKGKVVWAVMIRNDAADPAVYTVRATGEVQGALSVAQIVGIAAGAVAAAVAIVIVVVICSKRRKAKQAPPPLLGNDQ
jgi:hypothetical protein